MKYRALTHSFAQKHAESIELGPVEKVGDPASDIARK
jgi:hypothetical protein